MYDIVSAIGECIDDDFASDNLSKSSEMRTTDEEGEVCLTSQKEGGCVQAAGPQLEEATMKHDVGAPKLRLSRRRSRVEKVPWYKVL